MFQKKFIDVVVAIAFVTALHKEGRKNIIIKTSPYGAVVVYD